MTNLLDVSVLLALAWPNHPFYARARTWFSSTGIRGWATCLLTEAAFVRLSSNEAVVPSPLSPPDCRAMLEAMKGHGKHSFLSDTKLDPRRLRDALSRCLGHRQVNDAYLVSLAGSHSAHLVTFDRPLAALAGDSAVVELLI